MAASPLSRTPAVTWIVCLQGSAGRARDIVSATWARCYCSAYRLPSIEPKYTTPRSTAGDDTTAPMEMKRLKSRYMSWKSPKSGLNASRLSHETRAVGCAHVHHAVAHRRRGDHPRFASGVVPLLAAGGGIDGVHVRTKYTRPPATAGDDAIGIFDLKFHFSWPFSCAIA